MTTKKSKSPKIDLAVYRYFNAIPAFEELSQPYALVNILHRVDKKKRFLSLAELTALMGVDLENEKFAKAVKAHDNRIRAYRLISFLINLVLYLSIFILFLTVIISVIVLAGLFSAPIHLSQGFVSNLIGFLFMIIMIVVVMTALRLAYRITSTIIDRYYSDTLAYSACLFLLIHLTKENALMLVNERQRILNRIRTLRRYFLLLPYQYSVTELESTNWARIKFKQMENFIREKEGQIVAPLADTQAKIIDDFQSLLLILLTAQYGEFKYTSVVETELTALAQTDRRGWFLKSVGLITPLLLLTANFFFKDQFQAIGLDNQVVALIGLAWLLLAIDANLNLGIVDRITGLAKAMRELR